MHSPIRQQLLDHSLQAISLVQPLLARITRRDRDLPSQLRRAMSSVSLNLAEGFGSQAGQARLRFETARGSLCESRTALRVAVAWGHLSAADVAAAEASLDTLGARLYGLCRR